MDDTPWIGPGLERWDVARWESRLSEAVGWRAQVKPYIRRRRWRVGGAAPEEVEVDGGATTRSMVLRLVDVEGVALGGEPYEVELDDGSFRRGQLDDEGLATLMDLGPGQAKVRWPNLHIDDWAS